MKDKDPFEDAALEAFTQGKGELAQRLREMPQPEPSPELDAAILGRIEAELKQSAGRPAAMNDPVGPSFLTRWRVPLAAAAGGLFALVVVMHQALEGPQQVAVEARAPAAALTPEANTSRALEEQVTSERAQSEFYQFDRGSNAEERKSSARELRSELPLAAQSGSASLPKPDAAGASAEGAAKMSEPAQVAETDKNKRLEEPALAKLVPPPQPDVSTPPLEELVAGGSFTAQRYGTSNYQLNKKLEAEVAPPTFKSAPQVSADLANPPSTFSADSAVGTLADAAPVPAPVAPLPSDAVSISQPVSRADAAGRVYEYSPPPPAAAVAAVAPTKALAQVAEEPKLWLERIEKLLNGDKPEQAWPEWEKFRKAYPQYSVDGKLEARLKDLKNGVSKK